MDPTNRAIVYASASAGGILRSGDTGATWTPMFSTGRLASSIAIDPVRPTTIYLADGSPFKSIDSGATWSAVDSGIPYGVTRIAVDPSDDSILYAASSGLYRSRDAGRTWGLTLTDPIVTIAPDSGHPGTVYASPGHGVWRSLDSGTTWSLVGSLGTATEVTSLTCDANGVVYAAAFSTDPYFSGLPTPMRSTDGGATWSSIGGWGSTSSGLPFTDSVLAVDLAGTILYAGTDRGVWQIRFRATRELSLSRP